MKKIILASILSIMILTGCGKKETITCKQTQTTMGINLEAEIKINLEGNRFQSLNMTIDAILPETYLNKKDIFINSFEKSYASYEEKYGVKPVISESEKGVKITADMTAEQAMKFSGSKNTKTSKKEVTEAFEKQGYTCE